MRLALKFLGSMSLAVALVGFLACGGGGGGTTDKGAGVDTPDPGPQPDTTPQEDTTPQPDTTPPPDVAPEPGPDYNVCTPECEGKECGPDGCDGSCGTCEVGTCNETTGQCECTPDCTGKECGDDGCGGSCGTCDDPAKPVCNEQGICEACTPDCTGKECGDGGCPDQPNACGTCADPAKPRCSSQGVCIEQCTLPDTWGSTGVITKLETPADAAEVAQICPDYSGDGKGDSGLRLVAGTINPEVQKAIAGGDMGILFEFEGVTDFVNTAAFDLNGLVGEPEAAGSTNFLIEEEAYNPETCEPLIAFNDAELANGTFTAGPSVFILDLAALGVDEVPLVLKIGDAQLSGDVTAGGPDGVTVENGILAGVITKALVEEALAIAEEQCNVPEPPSFCSYLGVAKELLPMLFDLDQDGDGKKDAMSVCFKYELGPAKVVGYKPAQ